ncbi:MAG: peptidoglycan DD-metalloendopeptidase family protein [Crocinitomicaceae bacterium]|nr:peptidoglycan DD-metalloendopeptidase family protein [Crocinitomicaceae bacterium]
MIENLLKENQDRFGDIFDFKMTSGNTVPLDFTKENPSVTRDVIYDAKSQETFVFNQIEQAGGRVGVGGYLENRNLYTRSSIFENEEDSRSIHLGIDLWIEAGTTVFAPFDGEIFSVKNNKGTGDYGPTIILKHTLEGIEFYSLYGHLSMDALNLKKGDAFSKGDKLCELGNYPINGDWAPHLHFQLLTNLDDFKDGDYPAVCTESNKDKFSNYCPNPNLMLRIPSLD